MNWRGLAQVAQTSFNHWQTGEMNLSRPQSIALSAALYLSFSFCLAAPTWTNPLPTMNDKANKSTAATSTFCIGRFLIEVPTGSKLSGGNYKYDFSSIAPASPMAFEAFEKEVAQLESTLNSARNNRTKQSMLLRSVQPDKNTRILAYWEVEASTAQIKISGYRWIDSSQFLLEDIVDDDKRDLGIEGMRDTLLHLRPRADTEIPTDPGYCFAGGFIANPRWRNEEAGVDIDIAGHPDAFVSVWIYPLASHKKDRPLLERMGGIAQALGNLATSVRVLRKGDRQIGLYKGQEHLASAPNSGGMRGHAFVWETQGDGTLDTPAIKIELTTGHQDSNGNPQQTTLTDQQAIKLWDDILNSFRLRPSGPVKTSALAPEPPPILPLGKLVR